MTYTQLEKHIAIKAANLSWLSNCLEKGASFFPYRISTDEVGEVLYDTFCFPENQNAERPEPLQQTSPCFLVNIPDGRTPSRKPKDVKYAEIVQKLKTEAFSTTSSASSRMSRSRLVVVIGTNQAESLDPRLNEDFVKLIKKTEIVSGIACKRLGFLWRPKYKVKKYSSRLYTPQKSFLLLKQLSEKRANEVRKDIEEKNGSLHPHIREQIPFQLIREAILKSNVSRDFAQQLQTAAPHSPLYLTVMDADFLSLRADKTLGIFSKVLEVTSVDRPLSVIGSGYLAADDELPLIQLGVRIDMAVRAAMTKILPYSAYLPEPFLCVLLRHPNQNHHLSRLSFLGKGNALESRRLIENGKSRGVLDNGMAFVTSGIVTRSPERWKTGTVKKYTTLSSSQIKEKQVLQTLRGLSQSHLQPLKWAEQIYCAIDFSCRRVFEAKTPIAHIYGIFDPISRMLACIGHYSPTVFDQVLNDYSDPLSDAQSKILKESKAALKKLGMSQALIEQIVATAKASGEAIYKELKEATTA